MITILKLVGGGCIGFIIGFVLGGATFGGIGGIIGGVLGGGVATAFMALVLASAGKKPV